MKKMSPDDDDRIEDFLNRHGGPGPRGPREGEHAGGFEGWSEIYAADGYTLRCDWSQFGGRLELKFSEIALKDAATSPLKWGEVP